MKSNLEIAGEVLQGLWGNGNDRIQRLTSAGYDYTAVQYLVNKLVKGESIDSPEIPNPDNYNSTAKLLNIEVDLTKYDGVTLIIKGV